MRKQGQTLTLFLCLKPALADRTFTSSASLSRARDAANCSCSSTLRDASLASRCLTDPGVADLSPTECLLYTCCVGSTSGRHRAIAIHRTKTEALRREKFHSVRFISGEVFIGRLSFNGVHSVTDICLRHPAEPYSNGNMIVNG